MKKLIIFFFLSFLLITSNLNAQLYQDWKWLHQSPQGNDLRWVKMWDVNTIYSIGSKGTFIKTTDRGATWTFQHTAGRMSSIPLQRADLRNAWFFNQNTGIVVGTYGSIFRTTNGGITFDSVPGNPIPTNTTITGISFINNLTGYVISGLTNFRLMKTTDGGLNWNKATGTPPYTNPYDIYAFNENKLLVLNQLGDVCITTNGGILWNTYLIGSQVNFYKAVFTDANNGFACGDWGRCRYTTNGGFNWFNMSGVLFDRSLHFFDLKYRNGAVYLTGTSNYLWKSTNFGVTWDSIQFMSPSAEPLWSNSYYSSDFSTTGDTMITSGVHGSLHQSLSASNRITHSQYLKTGSLRDIRAVSPSGTVIAVGSSSSATSTLVTHDQILRSSNGGVNWSVVSPSSTSMTDFYSIEMIDGNTGFICGSKSAVYKTTNGGINWDSLIIPNMTVNLILSKIDFVNAQTGWIFSRYAAGNDSSIYKTTNGGVNWFRQKFGTISGNENTVNAAYMIDENNGWIINSKPRAWKTSNGGMTWDSTKLSDNYLAGALYDIKMLNTLTGYCCGSNNRTYKTTDGGVTPWTNVSFSSTTVITLYTLEFKSPLEGVVMGTYGTAYYTSNGGSSWTNRNLISSIDDIYGSYLSPDGKLYAVTLTNAGIFKNSNMFTVGIGGNIETIPREFGLLQNYPNPFNPVTRIIYELPRQVLVTLNIYDIRGRLITTLVNGNKPAGKYEVNFDTRLQNGQGSTLSTGVYFCRITAGEYSKTIKLLLIK